MMCCATHASKQMKDIIQLFLLYTVNFSFDFIVKVVIQLKVNTLYIVLRQIYVSMYQLVAAYNLSVHIILQWKIMEFCCDIILLQAY